MYEATEEGPGAITQSERDDLNLAIFVQLSRIYDVLLFQCRNEEGIDQLIAAHSQGRVFGPEPSMGSPE